MTKFFPALIIGLIALQACKPADHPVPETKQAIPTPPSPQQVALNQANAQLVLDINKALQPVQGRRSAAVMEIGSNDPIVVGDDAPMAQQSVSKLWVALALTDQVKSGQIQLTDTVTITKKDRAVFHQPLARAVENGPIILTVQNLLNRAITQSDNMANQILLDLVGGPRSVKISLAQHGYDIGFGPGDKDMQAAISGLTWNDLYSDRRAFQAARDAMPDYRRQESFNTYAANPIDGASARQMVIALADMRKNMNGQYMPIMQAMAQTKTGRARLKAGIPSGWTLRHKTGTGQYWKNRTAGFNDVGIMEAPDGRMFTVAVMIGDGHGNQPTMQKAIADVARAIALYHEKTNLCCSQKFSQQS